MVHVIAYDIEDDKRRTKVARVLKSYGYRVQRSVFECTLTEKKLKRMIAELEALLKPEDEVSIYQICEQCRRKVKRWGKTPPGPEKRDFLVIC